MDYHIIISGDDNSRFVQVEYRPSGTLVTDDGIDVVEYSDKQAIEPSRLFKPIGIRLKMKTITPTQEQFQTVIDNLEKANKMANHNASVNMVQGEIENPTCGSPMCHGGWYFIAKGLKRGDFATGAKAMAKDLGFKNDTDLEIWARFNPEIWGNEHGGCMFCDSSAFSCTSVTSLSPIIDHWKAVKQRALTIDK